MKFLAVPSLEKLSSLLSSVDLGDRLISCKVEAYSCKQAGDDKKFSKALERQISEEYFPNQPPALNAQHSSGGAPAASSSASAAASASHAAASSSSNSSSFVHFHSPVSSPPVPSPITPLGPISESSTRKLLISLIQTMNAALSDYDFSQVRPEQFTREPAQQKVKDSVNNLFLSAVDQVSGGGIREEFWQAVNDCIDCEKCEIYSFAPDPDSDLGDDKLWCVMYFFFNKKAKKILFLGAEAANKLSVDAASMAETPAPSKTGKHAGLKRAIDRSKRTSNSSAMMDESQSKSSDSLASSTDDDTENDLDEDAQQSKRRRRQKKERTDSMDEGVDDDSDDGGSSISATEVYSFDPDSDEQLAQIRQAAALEASEAKVSGSPLNMPLRAPQTGLVFSSLSSSAGDSTSVHHAPRFSFTTAALSPYIAAVGFQPTDAKHMPSLTLQPPAKTPMM